MRKREFTYAWCGITEVDYVCERCETIVLDPAAGCQHCHDTNEKRQSRLAAFLQAKPREEEPCQPLNNPFTD
jgi:hypothetical protein